MLVGSQQVRFNVRRYLNAVVSCRLKFQTSGTRWNFIMNVFHRTGKKQLAAGGFILNECDCGVCSCWSMRWSSTEAKTKTCDDVEKRTRHEREDAEPIFSLFVFLISRGQVTRSFLGLYSLWTLHHVSHLQPRERASRTLRVQGTGTMFKADTWLSNPFICLLRLRKSLNAAQSGLTRHSTLSFAVSSSNTGKVDAWPAKY